jgi:hypothetical protein
MRLSASTKKLLGTIIILVWLVIYACLVGLGIGAYVLVHAPWYVSVLYYALAGTLWIIPIGLLFPWMYREPAPKP